MKTATCHPERKHHGKGLCSACHRQAHREKVAADHRIALQSKYADGCSDTRQQLTEYLYVEKDGYGRRDIEIGSPPEYPMLRLALMPKHERNIFSCPMLPSMFSARIEEVTFRAIRKAWSDGNGTTVHWWDYEFAGR